MNFLNQTIHKITLPKAQREALLAHCIRKLNQQYLDHEIKERKAYGLIGGKIINDSLYIEKIAPLYKNTRTEGEDKKYMDGALNSYAQASETPLAQRGWVAHPEETLDILTDFASDSLEIVGAYHMHRVSWENDVTRERPSVLDTELAKDSGLFAFIISVVNPKVPVIRAFYEGFPDQELTITD